MSATDTPRVHGLSVDPSPRHSWFIGVAVAAVLYYVVSERDIRQVELARAVDTEQVTLEGEPA